MTISLPEHQTLMRIISVWDPTPLAQAPHTNLWRCLDADDESY